MIKWLGASIVAMLMIIVLISQEPAGAGMAPVGDEDLAEITAQTGINLYGSLKATAGNLIIASTAGGLKLGGWRLNNATTSTADPASTTDGTISFSQWGPFSINVGYRNAPAGKRAVLRIGLDARVNDDAPTWVFKNIQMWQDEDWSSYSGAPYYNGADCLRDDPSGNFWNYDWSAANPLTDLEEGTYAGAPNTYTAGNHTEAGWIDIGGLYLTTIHLWQSYIDIFNDGQTSTSQIQGYGRFFGTVERTTIQWGQTYLDGAAVIDNLTFSRLPVSTGGTTDNYMILGNETGGDPLVWDQTSNFRDSTGTIRMNNMRIWFPFEGSLTWDNFAIRDTSYTRSDGPVDANGYLNLGALEVNHLRGTITIDFPQQENPDAYDGGWWNY
ncbi:hypothetical protein SAMN02745216_02307 [Desulfatibacillum alkenivorans DSM 16219]|jgi:hypothetical protein|uniref:Uncharacterized protein n=1 Tax=Desulfatibacillum alkenivorans DSM 16219 TaxID=1121393 RepID=A0A1M6MBF6_9BACT|nr:hypothetical protein [Desulfatibacillum alkenivorans]SHJ80812.1 hypothetical protein SAMN02745216_02307 [Desulfatibacillum alkenivorans DSM 16219]